MVDCVYYEEGNLDKSKAEFILTSYFGKDFFEYDLNDSKRTNGKPFVIKKEDILNPTKDSYLAIRKIIWAIKENRPDMQYGTGDSFLRYNSILMILAAMTECIPSSLMEEWEGLPEFAFLNNLEK